MGHILITGPGRAGTTFLVQLLTRMGEVTGFEPYREPFNEDTRAGCESGNAKLNFEMTPDEARAYMKKLPRVIKAPNWAWEIKGYFMSGYVDNETIEHIILPFRDFDESAKSRLDVGLDWMIDETVTDPAEKLYNQAAVHAATFGRVMEVAYLYQVPLTVMRYPIFIQSIDYCYQRLARIFNFDYDAFKCKHEELAWT